MGVHSVRKAVFFDRDGVINQAISDSDYKLPRPPRNLNEWQLNPGIEQLTQKLVEQDFLLFVATNQPDVGRGLVSKESVEVLHDHLQSQLPLKEILACYHGSDKECLCRKPKPGLLTEAAQRHDLDLKSSWMIGDRWKDIEAGQKAGCRTIFVDYNYPEQKPDRPEFTVKHIQSIVELF